MKTVLSGKFCSDAMMDQLVCAIRESGAIQRSMEEARQYINQGLELLAEMPEQPERQALEELATYIVDRNM